MSRVQSVKRVYKFFLYIETGRWRFSCLFLDFDVAAKLKCVSLWVENDFLLKKKKAAAFQIFYLSLDGVACTLSGPNLELSRAQISHPSAPLCK